jgi:hypothetical protein
LISPAPHHQPEIPYRQARMRSLYKFRAPALLCAIAVVLCELIARPFAEMGIADFSYIRTTQKLAETGHLYRGTGPVFLHMPLRVLLTVLSIGGLFCLAAAVFRIVRFWPRTRSTSSPAAESMDFPQPGLSSAPNAIHGNSLSWHRLLVLLVPFAAAYCVLLLPRSAFSLFDRYLLALLLVVLILVLRFAQQHLYARLPWPALCMIGIFAIYGVVSVHNMFALYRARVSLVAELRAAGVPDIAIDDGPEDNAWVQLQHAAYLNDHRIIVPAHAFTPVAPSGGRCPIYLSEDTPLIRARYSLSFQANACYGPTAFTPVPYSRWLTSTPGALYVVNTVPPAKEGILPTAY